MDHIFKAAKPRDRRKSHWGAEKTARYRAAIIQRDGPNCWICGGPFKHREKPTLDHVRPKSKGGGHTFSNLKIAHMKCNTSRGNDWPESSPMREPAADSAHHQCDQGRNGCCSQGQIAMMRERE